METFKPFFLKDFCGYVDCLDCTVKRMQVCCLKIILAKRGLPEEIVDIILWKVFDKKIHKNKRGIGSPEREQKELETLKGT
jgi:hypothetical protein